MSILSLTMQVPLTSTASHGMMVPLLGIIIKSPGTRSVDRISSISAKKQGPVRRAMADGIEFKKKERREQRQTRNFSGNSVEPLVVGSGRGRKLRKEILCVRAHCLAQQISRYSHLSGHQREMLQHRKQGQMRHMNARAKISQDGWGAGDVYE